MCHQKYKYALIIKVNHKMNLVVMLHIQQVNLERTQWQHKITPHNRLTQRSARLAR